MRAKLILAFLVLAGCASAQPVPTGVAFSSNVRVTSVEQPGPPALFTYRVQLGLTAATVVVLAETVTASTPSQAGAEIARLFNVPGPVVVQPVNNDLGTAYVYFGPDPARARWCAFFVQTNRSVIGFACAPAVNDVVAADVRALLSGLH
jgi:hypothetical protein